MIMGNQPLNHKPRSLLIHFAHHAIVGMGLSGTHLVFEFFLD